VSPASIGWHLSQAGHITPQPHKRPKSSCIRFAAEQPNERWQADFTHWRLSDRTQSRSSAGSTTPPATRYGRQRPLALKFRLIPQVRLGIGEDRPNTIGRLRRDDVPHSGGQHVLIYHAEPGSQSASIDLLAGIVDTQRARGDNGYR
jgi:hypothetical protein